MPVLLAIAAVAGLAGGGWLLIRKAPAASSGEKAPAPRAGSAEPGAAAPKGAGQKFADLGRLGTAAIAAAVGGVVADQLQQQFFDPEKRNPTTDAAAPGIGAAVTGALVFVAGATAWVAIPAVALVAIALGLANSAEDEVRAARRAALTKQRDELLYAGRWREAWTLALQAAKDGYAGLGWRASTLGDMTTVPLNDGRELNIREALDLAYADAKTISNKGYKGAAWVDSGDYRNDLAYVKSKNLGDAWANAFEAAVPWLNAGALHFKAPLTSAERGEQAPEIAAARAELGLSAPRSTAPASTATAPAVGTAAPGGTSSGTTATSGGYIAPEPKPKADKSRDAY